MSTYERQLVVNDKEGMKYICAMDESNDIQGHNLSIPSLLEELSERERRSCIRFFPDSFYNLSEFEE